MVPGLCGYPVAEAIAATAATAVSSATALPGAASPSAAVVAAEQVDRGTSAKHSGS